MEINIIKQQYNPLLKRKEILFKVDHTQTKGTPSRLEIRSMLAEMFKTNSDTVYVKRIETKSGTMTAIGEANVYETAEQAKIVEPSYIILRGTPKEERKEKTEAIKEKAPPPAKKEE
jgi:small subunit ribosomal protein S24e